MTPADPNFLDGPSHGKGRGCANGLRGASAWMGKAGCSSCNMVAYGGWRSKL